MQLGQLLNRTDILLDQPLTDAESVLDRLAGHYALRLQHPGAEPPSSH